MKNYVQSGDDLTVTAPAGGTTAGLAYLIGSIFGIAASTVAAGADVVLARKGVFNSLPKVTGTAWGQGDSIYWDNAAKNFTKTSAGNTKVGIAAVAALSADPVGSVLLVPFVL